MELWFGDHVSSEYTERRKMGIEKGERKQTTMCQTTEGATEKWFVFLPIVTFIAETAIIKDIKDRSTREKLGFGLRALCLLDRYSATWATHPTPLLLYLFSGRDFHFCPGLDSDHDPPPTYGLPQSWDYRNVPPLLVGWEGVSLTIHQWLGALNCHPPNLYLLCSW
jgi:hypothetical protein